MIRVYVFVFVSYVTSVLSQLSLFTGHQELYEGETCNRTDGIFWTCQRPHNCPSALEDLKRNKRPTICSYDDKTPIICCKDEKSTNEPLNRGEGLEGDVCDSKEGVVWTCQRLDKCPSAIKDLKENKRPVICSYDDKTPIICCRDTKPTHEPLIIRNSQEACQGYQKLCKVPGAPSSSSSFRRASATSKKIPVEGSGQPQFAIGGVNSAPKEFPHMRAISIAAAIGGVESTPKEYPHMALIGYGEVNSISWSCGGSLISDQFILSAAHCTNPGGRIGPARWVRLGDLNIATSNDDAKPQEFTIISRINHPDYKPPVLYNDIALYKIDQTVIFSPYISPVCLQSFDAHLYEKVTAIGWGRIGPSGPKSKHLMKVEISVVPQNVCNTLVIQEYQLPKGIEEESMICAGEMEGGKDTCQGDSGGPLMQRIQYGCVHQQIGVTSFGRICGSERSPGVYTRVSKFIPWIESIVWS